MCYAILFTPTKNTLFNKFNQRIMLNFARYLETNKLTLKI